MLIYYGKYISNLLCTIIYNRKYKYHEWNIDQMFVQFLFNTSIIQVGNENKIVILVFFFHQEIKMQGIEELSTCS